MEHKRELYDMTRFFAALFAVLALVSLYFGATGYDGSDSAPGLVVLAATFSILFGVCLGAAWGLHDNLKGAKA